MSLWHGIKAPIIICFLRMSQLRDMGLYLPWGVLLCYGIELGKSILVWFDQSDRSIWRMRTNETGLVHSVDNVRPPIPVCSPVQLWLAKELWECLPAVSAGNLRVNPGGRNVNKAFSQIDLSFPWLRLAAISENISIRGLQVARLTVEVQFIVSVSHDCK